MAFTVGSDMVEKKVDHILRGDAIADEVPHIIIEGATRDVLPKCPHVA